MRRTVVVGVIVTLFSAACAASESSSSTTAPRESTSDPAPAHTVESTATSSTSSVAPSISSPTTLASPELPSIVSDDWVAADLERLGFVFELPPGWVVLTPEFQLPAEALEEMPDAAVVHVEEQVERLEAHYWPAQAKVVDLLSLSEAACTLSLIVSDGSSAEASSEALADALSGAGFYIHNIEEVDVGGSEGSAVRSRLGLSHLLTYGYGAGYPDGHLEPSMSCTSSDLNDRAIFDEIAATVRVREGEEPRTTTTTTVSAEVAESTVRHHSLPESGFSVSLPSDWLVVNFEADDVDAELGVAEEALHASWYSWLVDSHESHGAALVAVGPECWAQVRKFPYPEGLDRDVALMVAATWAKGREQLGEQVHWVDEAAIPEFEAIAVASQAPNDAIVSFNHLLVSEEALYQLFLQAEGPLVCMPQMRAALLSLAES